MRSDRAADDHTLAERDRLYLVMRDMAVTFRFPPGQRINEVALAKELSTSRTPLREAMQRLVSEGLLTSEHRKGYFCRPLDAKAIFDLYELRRCLEVSAVRLACERATDAELRQLEAFLLETADVPEDEPPARLLRLDEQFHESVASLSRNQEFVRTLENVNARIYFVRWIDMGGRRTATQGEHRAILQALKRRDAEAGATLMQRHIGHRMEQITEFIREGFSRIYMGESPARPRASETVI